MALQFKKPSQPIAIDSNLSQAFGQNQEVVVLNCNKTFIRHSPRSASDTSASAAGTIKPALQALFCGCSYASSCHQSHRSRHSRQQHLLHCLAGHPARQIGQRQRWGQRLPDPRGDPKQCQAPCEVQDPTAGASVWMSLSAGPPCGG